MVLSVILMSVRGKLIRREKERQRKKGWISNPLLTDSQQGNLKILRSAVKGTRDEVSPIIEMTGREGIVLKHSGELKGVDHTKVDLKQNISSIVAQATWIE